MRKIKDITRLMLRNKGDLLLIIAFDVLFVLVLLILRFIQISVDSRLFPLFSGTAGAIYSIFYVILELFFIILVYSFFKYFIVKFVQEGFKKAEFKLKSFISFLKLNFIIFIPLIIIIAFLLNYILFFFNNWLSKGGIDPFKFIFVVLGIIVFALVFFVFVYTLISILHFSFFKEKSLKMLLKKGIVRSSRVVSYKVYLSNFKVILIAGVFLLLVHVFVKSVLLKDFSTYIRNYGNYKLFIYWVIGIVLYFLLLLNRFNLCIDLSKVDKEKS